MTFLRKLLFNYLHTNSDKLQAFLTEKCVEKMVKKGSRQRNNFMV